MSSTFARFKRLLEGYLITVGAGYLIDPNFMACYMALGPSWFHEDSFWEMNKISTEQAQADSEWLYGILVTATVNIQHKILMKYEASQDGIFEWYEFKQDFQCDGSKVVRIETLEALALVSFSNTEPGEMATFIDKFQNYMAELD